MGGVDAPGCSHVKGGGRWRRFRWRPYPHQVAAVYEAMLPQVALRFLLADEPGTGKTIMAGLWLRESQRLGFVRRVIIVSPAHLVTKWQFDFERFFGGGLRRITADTIREDGLATPHDTWIVSLELAAMNQAVYEAIHPDRAGFDAVIFDEAHRLTPTAVRYHRVGTMLAHNARQALLMTATPHRGQRGAVPGADAPRGSAGVPLVRGVRRRVFAPVEARTAALPAADEGGDRRP